MENWIIITKLTLLIYCAFKYVEGGPTNPAPIVFSMLIYLSVNVAYHLVRHKKGKIGLLLISATLLMACALNLNGLFIFLLPANLYEMAQLLNFDWRISALISFLSIIWINQVYRPEYIVLGILTYIIYTLLDQLYHRIRNLSAENDEIRENVHILAGRLNKDIEYEQQIKYSSQLEERNKLAQEIHDKVGHTISGSLIQLEASKLLVDQNPAKAKEILQSTINILREGMENIRATLRNIKPAAEQLGINRIRLTLDELSVNHSLKTTLVHTGNLELISLTQWKVIYENILEALTNTLKYASATTVSVNIEVLNTFIKAEVKDNGVGTYTLKKGLGIRGMEERSGSLDGKIIVDGSKGFSVITLLPLEGAK